MQTKINTIWLQHSFKSIYLIVKGGYWLKNSDRYKTVGINFQRMLYKPNATVQQSLLFSPSVGSMLATGESFCLGSQTLTVPVTHMKQWHFIECGLRVGFVRSKRCSHHLGFQWRSQVHRLQSPGRPRRRYCSGSLCGPWRNRPAHRASPGSWGPHATDLFLFLGFSLLDVDEFFRNMLKSDWVKYHMFRFPSKSPVAMCLCWREVAPNVPHLMGLGFSTWNNSRGRFQHNRGC